MKLEAALSSRLTIVSFFMALSFESSASKAMPLPCTIKGKEQWVMFEGFCYGFDIRPTKFHMAASQCRLNQSELVSIHSDAESESIGDAITAISSGNPLAKIWIGLQEVQNGTYQWLDGTQFQYRHWLPSEPRRGFGEMCVAMFVRGGWSDNPCWSEYSFICKVPIFTNKSTKTNMSECRRGTESEECQASWLYKRSTVTSIYVVGGVIIVSLVASWLVYGLHMLYRSNGRHPVDEDRPGYEHLRIMGAASAGDHLYASADKT